MVAIRNMSLLSSSKTISELFGEGRDVRVMIARVHVMIARVHVKRRNRRKMKVRCCVDAKKKRRMIAHIAEKEKLIEEQKFQYVLVQINVYMYICISLRKIVQTLRSLSYISYVRFRILQKGK